MIKKSRIDLRIIAFILMVSLTFLSLPIDAISLSVAEPEKSSAVTESAKEDSSKLSVLHNGVAKSSVVLNEDGKEVLTSHANGIKPTERAWQILTPSGDRWINIQGCNSEELSISYSLVGSMLNSEGCAYVRSYVKAGGDAYVSEPFKIVISYNVDEENGYEESKPMMLKATRAAASSSTEPELETYTIVINYIFDNGTIAFEAYGATVAAGSNFSKTVESPKVIGYEPFMRSGENYVDASKVVLNYTDIRSNITINVIYEPAMVDFKVHHHLQNLYDDDYSLTPDFITEGKGLTSSTVPDGLELTEDELPGFKALAYEKLTVAADGSTVVEIRYDRNYYLVDFAMDGGFGVEPVYTRYGSQVGANVPTKHGYVFDGWELVSYGGELPSAEEASMYDINAAVITVPNASLTYRAKWITQLVKYSMVFWKENIDDEGFTYWGHLDGLMAMSGSLVNGADRVSEVGGIDDEAYFTYNDVLTDKNVVVEGDGSTVVNVYYVRNRYTITFKAEGLCTIPESHSHTDACYRLLCTKGHTHTDACNPSLACDIPAHTEHTSECLSCNIPEHTHSNACCGYTEHTHIKSCYSNVGNAANPNNAPTNVENGYIYAVRTFMWYSYYICINGTWYSYSGRNVSSGDVVNSNCGYAEHTHGTAECQCELAVHSHTDSCYKDSIHIHDPEDCYTYSCGDNWHEHVDGCFVLHCHIPVGHTHTSTCKNASSTNTVKTVYKKYQENLEDIWPITDDNGVTYNSGERWAPSNSSTYSEVLVYIANMPGESFTLTLDESKNDTYTMNYYTEVLEGESYDVSYNGKNYVLYTTIKANYNYITESEDFFDINGYYQLESNPKFSNGQIQITNGGTVDFYYGRIVDHYLQFTSNGVVVNERTVHGIAYGASLKDYYFEPDYPASLEPNAYVFGGWYTSAGHYDGTEVDWDSLTMDEGDVMLYAKWVPITHTVKVYTDSSLSTQVGETQLVSHNNFAAAPSEVIENDNYIFQGWFYRENVDGEIVEKAFVFTGIPIIKDIEIYAKWSSHVAVNFTIRYVLERTGEEIAPPTVGSSISGHNKTFYAKAGNELYEGFREGYYPTTNSHTVTMSAESDHEFTFEYIFVDSMPYLVKYLDVNGNDIISKKYVLDNNYSVVTETFIKVDKMMPDAYQKRLVLSASGVDSDNDGIYDENVIVFNYSSDEEHAYYRTVYYIENLTGDGYREFRSEDAVGTIGTTYTISSIAMTGFSFNGSKSKVNGVLTPAVDGAVSATLTSDGLLIELYYDRVDVGYVVKYLEAETDKVLYEEKLGEAIYGEQVVEYAPGLTHIGYTLVSDSVKQLHISANESLNVIEFYYQETVYSIKYQIIGDASGAMLSSTSENVKAVSGNPSGSTLTVNEGYHLVGWFYDAACSHPVPAEWYDSSSGHITPKSDKGIWLSSHTYYAKVDPDFSALTINTLGCADVDARQIFIFRIKGVSDECMHIDLTVTVIGNSSVTVSNLPIGQYSVTELAEWSYRYTPDSISKNITLTINASGNQLTFSHARTNVKWLDGNDNAKNNFN